MKVKKTGIFYIFVNRKGFIPVKGRLIPPLKASNTVIDATALKAGDQRFLKCFDCKKGY